MALNETQRTNLKKLDVIEGTGIFTNNTKVDSINEPTIVISLGGLGGKTLSKLKKEINHRINKEGNCIRLLAIDSSDSDAEALLEHGCLTKDEVFSLYTPEIHSMFNKPGLIPDYIRKWLNPDWYPSVRCFPNRQNVRLLLALPMVYHKVREKLKEIIISAKDLSPVGRMNVFFVAGISGGTGGGILLDMAYLFRDVMEYELGYNPDSYRILAQIYMPDVQFGCGANEEVLKATGYAALKEIDYFMNIEKINGEYEWPFEEGNIKNKHINVFDDCTLISARTKNGIISENQLQDSIGIAIESLMTLITNAEQLDCLGMPHSIINRLDDCFDSRFLNWRLSGYGSDRKMYPVSANYGYNVIGYGTAKIPVDAIMSYIALKMYENVFIEYYNMKNFNADYVSRLMASVGVGNIDTIIKAVKDYAQYSYNPADLPSGSDVHSMREAYKFWRDRALEHYITYRNTQLFSEAIDRVTQSIIGEFDRKINIAFGEHGPYFASKLITASFEKDDIDGIIKKIDKLIKTMGEEYDARIQKCNTVDKLISVLDQNAADIPAFLGIVKQEVRDEYLYKAKTIIEKFTIEMEIIVRMQDKLVEVKNFLADTNNNVFNVYMNVLKQIKEILEKNSDLVLKSNSAPDFGDRATYSIDVVNLDAEQEKGRRLKTCLDSLLTPEFLAKFKDSFEEMLRAPENRPLFTDTTDKFNAAKLIQKLFDELLGNFYVKAMERLLIAYYYPQNELLSIEELDAIMDDETQKNSVLMLAAEEICHLLDKVHKIRCDIINGSIDKFMYPIKCVIVPSKIEKVFRSAIEMTFGNDVCIYTKDNSFSVDVFTCHQGIPLTSIRGIEDLDKAYDNLVVHNHSGIHLDESDDSWFRMFPMPFVKEAWCFVEEHQSITEQANIRFVEKLADKLNKYNLISYDTKYDKYTSNTKIDLYFEADISEELIAKFKEYLNIEGHIPDDRPAFIKNFLDSNSIPTSMCPIKINGSGEFESSVDNISKILRKNITLLTKIKIFIEKYEIFNDIIDNKYVSE